MWCRVPLKGRLAHLNKYNMVLTTSKRHSFWKAPVLSLKLALFFHHAHSLEKLLSLLHPQSLPLSVLQLVTEEVLMMSHWWGYWCHLHSILSSPWLNLSLVVSLPVPRSLSQLGQHFPSPSSVMSMLIFKCMSPSLLTLACCQGQALAASAKHRTRFDGVSCRLQNIWRTLYIKALGVKEAAVVSLETVVILQMVQVRCSGTS